MFNEGKVALRAFSQTKHRNFWTSESISGGISIYDFSLRSAYKRTVVNK